MTQLRNKWDGSVDVYTEEDKEELIQDLKDAGYVGVNPIFSDCTEIYNLNIMKMHGLMDFVWEHFCGFDLV